MNLTPEDVREIIQLLDSSPFDELHVETDRLKLTLRRSADSGWTQESRHAPRDSQARPGAAGPAAPATVLEPGMTAVTAPLVGAFYRAPKPGAAPFVEVGSVVGEDTVVAIIETMKLMNAVQAGARGTVAAICAENAEFVEQGRILFKLRADGA
ncbi:MAG TPA: biotin/lipoyl-containing protein [Rhizomicrobium sp.]